MINGLISDLYVPGLRMPFLRAELETTHPGKEALLLTKL